MAKAIGIDFGTSNSTVGTADAGGPFLIALEDGRQTLPSAVFYDVLEKKVFFGREAIAAYVDHNEGRLLRSLKSILGSSLIEDTTQIGGQRRSFQSIITEFLGHLKKTAELRLEREIDSVVLGRPVWFVDRDASADLVAQQQLESAAQACGFKHIQFQYEPVAAALDYEQSVTREELALIVDIGGGTSDFSIVRVSPERRGKPDRKTDVLANTGVHVGGTDLDRRLSLDQVMPFLGYRTRLREKPTVDVPVLPFHELATWHKIIFLYNNKTMSRLRELRGMAARPDLIDRFIKVVEERNGHRLAGDVESAKMLLSQHPQVPILLNYVEADLGTVLHRKDFEVSVALENKKIVQQIHACVKEAGVAAGDITTLFMTGGTTAIPVVFNACKNAVPHARLVEGDKLGSVGIGLALDAKLRFGC